MQADLWLMVILWSLVFLITAFALFWFVYRPWQMNWGATEEEVNRPLPGDGNVEHPTFKATRAVSIEARPEDIWPWIIQIGYKKAGFYSYDRLDNDRIPSAERIIPEYQNLKVGDLIPMTKNINAVVTALETNRSMLVEFQGSTWIWAWELYEKDAQQTRLITRLHVHQKNIISRLFTDLFEIVMMRKHLLEIKQRAEILASS